MKKNKNRITFEKIKGGNSMEVALELSKDKAGAKAEISFLIEGLTQSERLPVQKTRESRTFSLKEARKLTKQLNNFIKQGEEFEAKH